MSAKKKTSGGRPKQNYNLEEAADFLGMRSVDLLRSRYRGLAPGKLGAKDSKGVLVWKLSDLKASQTAQDAPGASVSGKVEP